MNTNWAISLALVFQMIVIVSAAHGQAPTGDLVPILQPILARHPKIPGLVGAIVENDGVSAIGAVGIRKARTNVLFTDDDQIHLGSDTKAMTALLIGQLIDEKKVSFDQTVAQIFPDLAAKMNPRAAGVTVLELMHHRAGLPHDLNWDAIEASGKSVMEQRRMAVERAFAAEPTYAPGSQMAYSNVGYVVLGAIIEKRRAKPWEQVIRERLFGPLGMSSAGFGPPGERERIDQPWGHQVLLGAVAPAYADNPPVMGPAGRVHCSIRDWAKFISLYLDAAQGKPRLVSAAMFSKLTDPGAGADYAGGWVNTQRDWGGGTVLTHAGSNGMWYCVAWVAPLRGFAVLSAVNLGGDDAAQACDEASAAMIGWREKRDAGK